MNIALRQTEDGSQTLYNKTIDECYHSIHGAKNESNHIFIQSAFLQCNKQDISIFEVGFGTGLNAFLTLLTATKTKQKVHYETVELYPVPSDFYSNFNYATTKEEQSIFKKLHCSEWNRTEEITSNFSLLKHLGDIKNLELKNHFDIVYFDAFSPEKQPELWDKTVFEKLYNNMNAGAILTTYCAKGVVRRTLQEVGFTVERLAGPIGKREILRATKVKKENFAPTQHI